MLPHEVGKLASNSETEGGASDFIYNQYNLTEI